MENPANPENIKSMRLIEKAMSIDPQSPNLIIIGHIDLPKAVLVDLETSGIIFMDHHIDKHNITIQINEEFRKELELAVLMDSKKPPVDELVESIKRMEICAL